MNVNWGLGRACGDAWVTSCRPLSPPPTKGQRQPVRPTPILQYHSFSSKCKRQSKEKWMASIKKTNPALSICIQSRYAKPCLKVLFGHTKSQSLKIVTFWKKKTMSAITYPALSLTKAKFSENMNIQMDIGHWTMAFFNYWYFFTAGWIAGLGTFGEAPSTGQPACLLRGKLSNWLRPL